MVKQRKVKLLILIVYGIKSSDLEYMEIVEEIIQKYIIKAGNYANKNS